jgi:hypothetical protein
MGPTRLYIPITADEFARLRELAGPDRRAPVEMAAYLLARAIATYELHRAPTSDEPFTQPLTAASTQGEAEHAST